MSTQERKNLVIPFALVGVIVGLMLSLISGARTWGAAETRIATCETQIVEIKQSLLLLRSIDSRLERLTAMFEAHCTKEK